MSRSVPFRRTATDAVSWRQDQAQNATIYILREMGPTGFLLKEEGETKKFKVFLGDPHTCTCPVFKKEKDLCKHICWVLLKKFRIPREDAESFQLGLVEREINALLRGRTQQEARQRRNQPSPKKTSDSAVMNADGKEILPQREITGDDVCPICQDELLGTREPVTYCRFGCAKSIHIKCMKVWADHQQSTGETTIKCPLCREDFGQIEFLQKEYRNSSLTKTQAERGSIHRGIVCSQCNQSPIAGRCYRCTECTNLFLCQECFSANAHSQHTFQFRQKPNQRWRPAQRASGTALPSAVLEDLQNRELQDEDYELLLQLDSEDANKASTIPEEVVKSFPTEKVREGGALMSPGVQCRVCLRGFTLGQVVRRLPCRHKFHKDCIDQWLIHEHPTCPVDGTVVWNPIMANLNREERKASQRNSSGRTSGETSSVQMDIAGIGVTGTRGRNNGAQKGRRKVGVLPLADMSTHGTDDGLDVGFQLMGLGLSSKKPVSSQPSNEERTAVPHSREKETQPFRSKPNGNLCSRSQGLSIPSCVDFAESNNIEESPIICNPHRVTDVHDAIGVVAYANEGRDLTPQDSRASWLVASPSVDKNEVEEDIDINDGFLGVHINSRQVEMEELAQLRHKPPSGSVGRRSKPLEVLNHSPHTTSIPKGHEIPSLGLSSCRLQGSNSAPSSSKRTPALVNENVGQKPPERGRTERLRSYLNRRARSSSVQRRSSSEKLCPSQPDKLETMESLFLGSPHGKLVGVQGQRSRPGVPKGSRLTNQPHRASSLPGKSEEIYATEFSLSGYHLGLE
ncbi:E3 ubiquitin-protein ligase Zswim2 [Holothuria leucospilota]|uniref:E3 ubiquitin-protein ligase Zswim2 n=1 Tax=Holothuria leucospilota TaxID=206669 RepID=A0A9Q0YL23_HOLLE|nr:E3 ubiquitin-protein ligase Zswim2 [Holothuria leucospilota]